MIQFFSQPKTVSKFLITKWLNCLKISNNEMAVSGAT